MGYTEAEPFLAHAADDGRTEPLVEHVTQVSRLAGEFADAFGCRDVAEQIGLAHDIGKYSQAFQRRIRGSNERVDHSTAGAYELLEQGSWLGAYCVSGHHGGLPDGGADTDSDDAGTLAARIRKARSGGIEEYAAFAGEVELAVPSAGPSLDFAHCKTQEALVFSQAFATRMLFSCLVDADFLCTEGFMRGRDRETLSDASPGELAEMLEGHLARLKAASAPSELNTIRQRISDECLAAAAKEPGLFTCTVPTGGGKTLASMRFALNHAAKRGMRRIIYAIPYTSIIEQNAAVFRGVFGDENVLEHHSGFDFDDRGDGIGERLRLAAENWDAPIVVTTNVQLFESLFAAKTSRCRKLHNIAGSVIVLDEAQMLPVGHAKPCVRALAELICVYGCTVVLCTATQPTLDGFFEEYGLRACEIASDPRGLARRLERVSYEFAGRLTNEELAERIAKEAQALCILNSRAQAREVFSLLAEHGEDGVYHLSTFMHPVHRTRVLDEVRARLREGLSCRVVSTSLIEAGVDVDFPVVYRSCAGVDSIAQAAGRCNREGRLGRVGGHVVVFEPEEGVRIPAEVDNRAAVTRDVARGLAGGYGEIGTFDAIESYFMKLFHLQETRLDAEDVLRSFGRFSTCANGRALSIPFRSVAEGFQLIEDDTVAVLVPDDAVDEELEALREGSATRRDMRTLSRYGVGVYRHDLAELMACGAVQEVADGIYLLLDVALYDAQTGLDAKGGGGRAVCM